MEYETQQEFANQFRAMHRAPKLLVLPNAWDVATACIFQTAGFGAIATTSAGVANSLGYQDGQQISRHEMLDVVRRISTSVSVPVTADMEAGYAESDDAIFETAREVIDAGAVGLNLEDATGNPSQPLFDSDAQIRRIAAVVHAGKSNGVPLVINARTDSFWKGPGDEAARLQEAIRRGNAYIEAGADCIFIPGAIRTDIIEALCRGISGPVNILAVKGVPSVPELERMGVSRVSVGSGIMRAAMGLVRRAAQQLMESGTYQSFTEGAVSYDEMNALVGGK